MKRWALAVLVVALVAGCGGGDDDSDDTAASGSGEPSAAQTTPQDGTQPSKLTGERNEANVMKALGLEQDGDTYKFSGSGVCVINGFAIDKAGVEELVAGAEEERNVVKNDSGTAGVEVDDLSYFCAIQAANRLKNVP